MNTTLALYHSADFDGLACRAIAAKALGSTADLKGWDYGDDIPDLSPYDRVYIMDLSLPPAVMSTNAEKITWLDHHASAIKACPSYLAGTRIDGVAASRLAYQWFFGDRKADKAAYVDGKVKEPYAIKLLGEFDIWDKRDPNTDPFQLGIASYDSLNWELALTEPQVETFGALAAEWIEDVVDKGRAIGDYLRIANAKLVKDRGFTIDFEGKKLLALNTSTKGSMQFAAAVKPEHDGCLAFSWNGKDWGCSLYADNKDVDLSPIAVKYGGGGHKGACGFRLAKLPKELGGA